MSFDKKVLCAVCGTLVDQDKAIKVKLRKKEGFVCSESCRSQWEKIWKK